MKSISRGKRLDGDKKSIVSPTPRMLHVCAPMGLFFLVELVVKVHAKRAGGKMKREKMDTL